MTTLKYYLGFVLFSSGMFAILLNIIIIIPVFHLAFVKKTSTVYIIAFFNIVSDFGQLLTTGIFFGGSVMANHYILTEDPNDRLSKGSVIMATVFMAAWYLESWIQIVMSVNRYVVIKMNQHYIFTYRTTMILFIFLVPIPCISAYVMEYVLPCCVYLIQFLLISLFFVMSWMLFEIVLELSRKTLQNGRFVLHFWLCSIAHQTRLFI
ncbi:Protein CBG23689 [Caenorhabditis briggsae]|uniref:Protein CBG23689 n=1 Tax=Caenorhabditis briggsae TaxID=6238 RepID=A8WJ30_CAEBR|nr:Protein CBG23689 [Caenorhabditis briggsae]CAP20474.2 Protein CBG23689 [Caenorhabditis briggsae]